MSAYFRIIIRSIFLKISLMSLLTYGCGSLFQLFGLQSSIQILAQGQFQFQNQPPQLNSKPANATRSSYVPASNELYKKLNSAVGKVIVKKFGIPIAYGTGFFASREGLFITSRRLVLPLITDNKTNLEVVLADKSIIKDPKVINCTILSHENLCAFQIGGALKTVFEISQDPPEQSDEIYTIGHPRGVDFALTRTTIVNLTKLIPEQKTKGESNSSNLKINGSHAEVTDLDAETAPSEELNWKIDVAAPFAPGNDGAPVFDDQGMLIGVAGVSKYQNSKTTSVYSVDEVKALIESEKLPISIATMRTQEMKTAMATLGGQPKAELDSAIGFAGKSKALDGLPGFKDVGLHFDDKVLRLTLPSSFGNCEKMENQSQAINGQKSQKNIQYICSAYGDFVQLSVRRRSQPNDSENLLKKSGSKLLKSRPIDVVEELQRTESWDPYAKNLTAEQKRMFYSDATTAECQAVKPIHLSGAAFSDAPACRFSNANDSVTGSGAYHIWISRENYIYEVSIQAHASSLIENFNRIPILATLTARWEKVLIDSPLNRRLASEKSIKPLPSIKVSLPIDVHFMGSKSQAGKKTFDLYGKHRLLGDFEDGYVVALASQTKSYLPPDFDEITKVAAFDAAKVMAAKVQGQTQEIEALKISDRPARILNAFGKDSRGRDVLLLTCVIFFDDQTIEISQLALNKEPAELFKSFRTLLSEFKRQ